MEQRDSYVNELKNQLWNRDLELKTSSDKIETLQRNFDEFREKVNTQRANLLSASEREEGKENNKVIAYSEYTNLK